MDTDCLDHIVLISTGDLRGGREAELTRMFESVAAAKAALGGVAVHLFFLAQRDTGAPLPGWAEVMRIEGRVSLSRARNMLLARARDAGLLTARAVCAFPDDDAWYPAGLLPLLAAAFEADPRLDFWFCRYGSAPVAPATAEGRRARLQSVLSAASSNTIFLRGSLAAAIGDFDEGLGVGTARGGGEDTEYAIRAYHLSRRSVFAETIAVGHRDFDKALRSRYYHGTLFAIARHSRRSSEGIKALLRKVAVGFALVVRRELKPSALAEIFGDALR